MSLSFVPQKDAEAIQAFLQSVVDTVRDALLVLDGDLCVVSASQSFYKTFGVTPEMTVGTRVYELGTGQWDIPGLRILLEDVLPNRSKFHDYEVEHDFPGLGRRVMVLNARQLYHPRDHSIMLLLSIEDITERRLIEQDRRVVQKRLRAAFEHENYIANTLQQAMLRTVPEDLYPGLAVAAVHEAVWAEAIVGGDFYDLFRLEDGRIAVVIGDVTGKGLVAALRTSSIKSVLRLLLREQHSPALALSRLNQLLCDAERLDDLPDDSGIVTAIAVFEPSSGTAIIACGGLEPPLLLRAIPNHLVEGQVSETIRFLSEEVNACSGSLLGISGALEFTQKTIQLNPGDILVMTTDGITEARRRQHDFFGYEGFTRAAVACAGLPTVKEMGQHLLETARTFAEGIFQDDVCLVLVRRTN